MKFEPGFVVSLREELRNVPVDVNSRIERQGGLCAEELLRLTSRPEQTFIKHIERVSESDLTSYDTNNSFVGLEALDKGEVVFCVLNDATSLLRFDEGLSLVGLKLIQSSLAKRCLLMVDPSRKDELVQHVNTLSYPGAIGAFEQFETYALTPDNRLMMNGGAPILVSTGTGDLAAAMQDSNVLPALEASGVKYVVVVEASSALAAIDPNILGQHIASQKAVTFSITERRPGDDEPIVAFCDGALRVAEISQVPIESLDEFGQGVSTWQSTGSLIVNVEALKQQHELHWIRTRQQIGGKLQVSYKRHISELSFVHDSAFVKVPRESHFFRVRNVSEMKRLSELLFQQW